MQLNFWFFAIAIAYIVLWKVDLFASLWNMKSLGSGIPEEFRDLIDPDTYERSQEYARAKAVQAIGQSSFSLIVLFVFWCLGGFGFLDEKVRAFVGEGGPILAGVVYVSILIVLVGAVQLPFSWYDTFILEEKFGFNRTTFSLWIGDLVRAAAISFVLGIPLLALLIWLFQATTLAWVWCWLSVVTFSLLLSYVAPSWILPMFNRFTPLPDGSLRSSIRALAEKCDYQIEEVSVMDGSRRSAKSNAFFTGFGKRKRIALFDTLIEKHTEPELLGVLAHEIGHSKRHHIGKSFLWATLSTGGLFYLLSLMMENRGLFDAFGVRETSIYVGFVLFAVATAPVRQIFSVAGNALSRKHEFEADAYAAEVTGDAKSMSEALRKLSRDNLSNLTPHPFYVFLNYTHPPVVERIRAINRSVR